MKKKIDVVGNFAMNRDELQKKTARLGELNTLLGMDKKEHPNW